MPLSDSPYCIKDVAAAAGTAGAEVLGNVSAGESFDSRPREAVVHV